MKTKKIVIGICEDCGAAFEIKDNNLCRFCGSVLALEETEIPLPLDVKINTENNS
jgi:rRNA maturation endonuclease Nob1